MKLYEAGPASANAALRARGRASRSRLSSARDSPEPRSRIHPSVAMPLPSAQAHGRRRSVRPRDPGHRRVGRPRRPLALRVRCARRHGGAAWARRTQARGALRRDRRRGESAARRSCRSISPRRSADDFGQVAGAIRAQLGRLDGLVHTAAFLGSLGPIEHQSFDSLAEGAARQCGRGDGADALAAAVAFVRARRGRRVHARQSRRGSARLLGRVRGDQGRTFGAGARSGGRVGEPAQSAHRRRRSRTDALAASRADASGRGPGGASVARSAGAALSSSARRAREGGERRADRRAGLARGSCGLLPARRAGDCGRP